MFCWDGFGWLFGWVGWLFVCFFSGLVKQFFLICMCVDASKSTPKLVQVIMIACRRWVRHERTPKPPQKKLWVNSETQTATVLFFAVMAQKTTTNHPTVFVFKFIFAAIWLWGLPQTLSAANEVFCTSGATATAGCFGFADRRGFESQRGGSGRLRERHFLDPSGWPVGVVFEFHFLLFCWLVLFVFGSLTTFLIGFLRVFCLSCFLTTSFDRLFNGGLLGPGCCLFLWSLALKSQCCLQKSKSRMVWHGALCNNGCVPGLRFGWFFNLCLPKRPFSLFFSM